MTMPCSMQVVESINNRMPQQALYGAYGPPSQVPYGSPYLAPYPGQSPYAQQPPANCGQPWLGPYQQPQQQGTPTCQPPPPMQPAYSTPQQATPPYELPAQHFHQLPNGHASGQPGSFQTPSPAPYFPEHLQVPAHAYQQPDSAAAPLQQPYQQYQQQYPQQQPQYQHFGSVEWAQQGPASVIAHGQLPPPLLPPPPPPLD